MGQAGFSFVAPPSFSRWSTLELGEQDVSVSTRPALRLGTRRGLGSTDDRVTPTIEREFDANSNLSKLIGRRGLIVSVGLRPTRSRDAHDAVERVSCRDVLFTSAPNQLAENASLGLYDIKSASIRDSVKM
jgi:hypothetical protein